MVVEFAKSSFSHQICGFPGHRSAQVKIPVVSTATLNNTQTLQTKPVFPSQAGILGGP